MEPPGDACVTTDLIERNRSIAYLGLLITVAGLVLLPLFLPIPPMLAIGIGIFGFFLTLYVGRIYSLLAGLLVAWSLIGLVVFDTTRGDARDTEEPIPVPAGYGFQLDPDSTNVEHMYDSDQMPAKQARIAAVHVVDYYIDQLAPEWTVVYRQETPESISVQLRKGDTSQGIGIIIHAFTPEGRPAVLDLRIRALVCGQDIGGLPPGSCLGAPIRNVVLYPGGGPVIEPNVRPLREPTPLPPRYGFVLDAGRSGEHAHVYNSTTQMSSAEAVRAQRAVMRYYEHALLDWSIVTTGDAELQVKDPDSTDGLLIRAYSTGLNGGMVTLEIATIYCPEDYSCTGSPG
jgi:hypothetical protein